MQQGLFVTQVTVLSPTGESEVVELRDPVLAAFLAWLIPGAGHLYQRRVGKGLLFFICILGAFFIGMVLGDGRVVYASFNRSDYRLPYLCQVGAGLPALPALVQSYRVKHGREPLMGGRMAPPRSGEELSQWQSENARNFELGTVYTMIAGLLNVLAIFDAWGGPMQPIPAKRKKESTGPPGAAGSS